MAGNPALYARMQAATEPAERKRWLDLWRKSVERERETASTPPTAKELCSDPATPELNAMELYVRSLFPGAENIPRDWFYDAMTVRELERAWWRWMDLVWQTWGELEPIIAMLYAMQGLWRITGHFDTGDIPTRIRNLSWYCFSQCMEMGLGKWEACLKVAQRLRESGEKWDREKHGSIL